MSDRERWIVYPLLFLALGSALRDKLFKETRAKQILCEQLFLVDQDGRPQAVLNGRVLDFQPFGDQTNGHVESNTVNATGLFQNGEPVVTPRLLLQQLFQLFGRMRLPQGVVPPPGEAVKVLPSQERPADPADPQPPTTQPSTTQPPTTPPQALPSDEPPTDDNEPADQGRRTEPE
ncbi:hypothetical protein [Botrimarina sp.]|uniref:hypothetical protein n=1 Tax=Botrimarina sp. TaxID=2795802 RepID=UPI0032F01520